MLKMPPKYLTGEYHDMKLSYYVRKKFLPGKVWRISSIEMFRLSELEKL